MKPGYREEKQAGQLFIGRAYTPTTDPSWNVAIMDFLADVRSQFKPSTERYYATQLTSLARWASAHGIPLEAFTARDMKLYMIERADKVSSMTCHHDGVCAKRFFAYAAREKFVERNVLADWQVRKAPTPYVKCPTAEELQALLRSIVRRWDPKENPSCRSIPARRRTFFRHRNLAIIAGLIETGCRAGELFALTMQDYQPQVPQIVIRTSKTDEPRIVPITPAWMELVNSYLAVRPKKLDSDYLFVGEYGLPLDVGDFGHALKRQVEFAGLAGITQHTLRHYAATNMNDKVGLVAAKALLGHRSIQTTVKYIRDGSRLAAGAQATANTLGNILQNKSTARARRKRII